MTRKRGSSPSSAGEKNDLRRLRDGTQWLVRPKAEAGAGFALRRSPNLPRCGGSSSRLPAVWRGEARAAIRDVAEELHLDRQTVKRLEMDYMREQLRRVGTPGPKVIGIDEISIRKGHTYRIVVSDLERRRPIWFGGDDRSEASMDQFYRFLGKRKAKGIRLAVMDMWKAFRNSTHLNAPQAAILFDKFHVMKHLGEALDQIRKAEYARLTGKQRQFIKGQKYTLLSHPQNLTGTARKNLKLLLAANKRLNTAYLLKESFGQLWDYTREPWARKFFENWRASLKWQRLKPYEKFAAMIERHWDVCSFSDFWTNC